MAKKKPYRYIVYLLVRFIAAIALLFPRSLALGMARFWGWLGFYLVWRHRDRTLKHLRIAFQNEKSNSEIHKIACGVFQNLAQTGIEILQFPKLNAHKITSFVELGDAPGVYKKLLSEGKGLISITAHIGNWELLAGVLSLSGISGCVIGRRLYYEPYNQWILSLRSSLNVPTVYKDESAKKILSVLKSNQCVGLLPDQDMDTVRGVFVPFFGKPAYTTIAPVKLAMATGAPIILNFLIRKPGNRYQLILGDILRPDSKDTSEESIRNWTLKWMKGIESIIRLYPEQWVWMHNRWRTQEK